MNERESAELVEIASGVGFTEGPVWTGDKLLVTSISRGKIYEIPLRGGESRELLTTLGGPNGAVIGPDGALWIAQNGGHVITQLPEPVVKPGIQRWDGTDLDYINEENFQAPNDLAFDKYGHLWFTDPFPRPEAKDVGRVWTYDTEKKQFSLQLSNLNVPNGLAMSPDGDMLFIDETVPRHLLKVRIDEGGVASQPEVIANFDGGPDGMAIDVEGNVYVACHQDVSAVVVCAADGAIRERIEVPDGFPTNVCFAGADMSTLIITSAKGGKVFSLQRNVPGLSMYSTSRF